MDRTRRPGIRPVKLPWTTSDWNHYWTSTEPSREVVLAQERWVERIIKFQLLTNSKFDSVADFGCGPAIALFELARRLPDARFYGFDESAAVIRRNSDKARALGLPNITFARGHLPEVPRGSLFSLILCIATLHYVKDSGPAIRNLFAALKPGGFLVFNYPNLYSMNWYRKNANSDMRERFALVLAGKNILSKRTIESVLGRPSHNFWTKMGESAQKANPCLLVAKPYPNL